MFNADGEGGVDFHPATEFDMADFFPAVQRKIHNRGLRWLHRHGHLDDIAVHTLNIADLAGGWSVDTSVTIAGTWD